MAGLVAVECAFLVASAQPLWSSSPQFFASTRAEQRFERLVGSSVVGFGSCPQGVEGVSTLGMLVNTNDAYGVVEFSDYDGMTPMTYYRSWARNTGTANGVTQAGNFCPAITSVRLARHYGVAYILDPPTAGAPRGTRLVATVGGVDLYRVPGVARATLVPAGGRGEAGRGAAEGAGRATLRITGPASWRVVLEAARPATLELRLTDEPGWHATIDGRPLALRTWDGAMLEARVPPGHHVVELTYFPAAFAAGLAIAGCTVIGIVVAAALVWRRSRSRPRHARGRRPSVEVGRPPGNVNPG